MKLYLSKEEYIMLKGDNAKAKTISLLQNF